MCVKAIRYSEKIVKKKQNKARFDNETLVKLLQTEEQRRRETQKGTSSTRDRRTKLVHASPGFALIGNDSLFTSFLAGVSVSRRKQLAISDMIDALQAESW